MFKEKFILKIDTTDFNNVDPNLEAMIISIAKNRPNIFTKNDYDFEICVLIDGFRENNYINKIVTEFYHDISDKYNQFHFMFKSEVWYMYLQKFIKSLFTAVDILGDGNKAAGMYKMITKIDIDNEGNEFNFNFYVPKTLITDEQKEKFLRLGWDALYGLIEFDELFEYLLPYLYIGLARENLWGNKALKDPFNYYISLE